MYEWRITVDAIHRSTLPLNRPAAFELYWAEKVSEYYRRRRLMEHWNEDTKRRINVTSKGDKHGKP